MKVLSLTDYVNLVKDFLHSIFGKEVSVIALAPLDSGWKATAETLLDEEYTKKHAQDDVIQIIEVTIGADGKILSYARVGTRVRGTAPSELSG